jgi:hypothetical protein
MPGEAYAAVSKISSVSVKFTPEGYDFRGVLEVDASVKDSASYQADSCESAEDYYESESNPYEGETGVYVVELTTNDGYQFRFTSSDKNKITLSGMGAALVKAQQEDNGHTLRIITRLEDMDAYAGEVEDAYWDGCRAAWSEDEHAAGYRLRLMDTKGRYHYAETAGTSYDFSPMMLKKGTYTYAVRPVSKEDSYGEWTESTVCTVSEETAQENREEYEVKKLNHPVDDTIAHTPSNNRVEYLNTGWQQDEEGRYWYHNQDGTYPQHVWQKIADDWYYFSDEGYLLQDAYITWKDQEYYVDADGKLLTDGLAPDGRTADENGVLVLKEEKKQEETKAAEEKPLKAGIKSRERIKV